MRGSKQSFQFARFILIILFLATAFLFYSPNLVPPLSSSGFLGEINRWIVVFLFLLAARQFFYLFFSACEEIRRERLPRDYPLHPISIIVPAYNEGVVIHHTIRNLLMIDYPDFEIILVDDGSSDDTYSAGLKASMGDPRVRAFRKTNGGKAAALNYGISYAKNKYIFCMDADSIVHKDALRMGIRHFVDPDIVAVAGSVLVLNQINSITQFQAMEYLTGLNFFKSAQSYLGLVMIIPGPSGLFRRSEVVSIGGYKADTFAEDCDLTLRLVIRHGRIVYEPLMEVRTEIPEQVMPLIKQRYRWNRGILQALSKHLRKGLLSFRQPHVFVVILYMALETLVLPIANVTITLLSLGYVL